MNHLEQLRYLILAAQREGNRVLQQELAPLGLTPAQSEALRILGENESLTLTGLGEMLVCESGTNPSRLVDRLVISGLVRRNPGSGDRRQIELSLTESGREMEVRVRAIEAQLYELMAGALPDPSVMDMIRALKTITAGSPSGIALTRRIGSATEVTKP
ncbi:MarR family winged helix-turn-helix transcriptional regulator [Glaciihabitans sp. dw_435]|uniref:MarR family winged helix-turn-helix transcriptional regulator n=1 Tax=Glaciihabitans sp. dw_435 TaxID=2720081 RepID=UPI001BD53AC0|nr:MarR family transcriptional regulator [Glaciihabitans sp. dw_435]